MDDCNVTVTLLFYTMEQGVSIDENDETYESVTAI
jgi:hypothetical protein